MTCSLSSDELFILDTLYSKGHLKSIAEYHREKLENIYIKMCSTNFDKAIKNLIKKGYIAPIIKKGWLKYHISDIKLTRFTLESHGYGRPHDPLGRLNKFIKS